MQQLALGEHRHAGGAAAHVDHRRAELALVLDQRGEARRPSARRPARSISRSQRAMQAPSVRSAVAAASMMCSRAVSVVADTARAGRRRLGVHRRRSRAARHGSSRARPRRGACAPSCTTRRMSCSVDRAAADRPLHVEQPRFRLAAGQVDGDARAAAYPPCPRPGRRGADRASRPPPDRRCRRRARRAPCCQPKPSTRSVPSLSMRPIRQTILVVPMSSTPNGPAAAPWRGRAGVVRRRSAGGGSTRRDMSFIRWLAHVGFFGRRPARRRVAAALRLGIGAAPAGPAAAGRSPASGRSSSACCLAAAAIRRSAPATSWPSGSSTSVPLLHPQVPAPLADAHRGDHARSAAPAGRSAHRSAAAAAAGAPAPTTSGRWRNCADVLVGDHLAARGRSARICPGSARSRTAGAPAD